MDKVSKHTHKSFSIGQTGRRGGGRQLGVASQGDAAQHVRVFCEQIGGGTDISGGKGTVFLSRASVQSPFQNTCLSVCLSVCVISLCPPSMGSLDCCPRGDTPLCRAGLRPLVCPTCGSEASGAPSPQSSAKKQCPLVGLAGAAPTPVRLRKDKPRAPALLPRTSDVPLGLERFPGCEGKEGAAGGPSESCRLPR